MEKQQYIVINDKGTEMFNAKPSLEDLYEVLNCRCVTCVTRKIGDKYYDIWADDEGLLVDSPRINAGSEDAKEILCGNLLIANSDGEGNISPLSDDDIVNIKQQFFGAYINTPNGKEHRYILKYWF